MAETPSTGPEWQAAYLAALFEVDRERRIDRIDDAEDATTRGLQSNWKIEAEEAQPLLEAIHHLHFLRAQSFSRSLRVA